jgi:hypothetical protein
MLPVPRNAIRRTRLALGIIPKFNQCHGGKILRAVPRWMAQRFQQACADDDWNRMPELANLSASAIVTLGGRVLRDLLSRSRSTEEIRAHLEHAANEELEGYAIDVDAE